MRERNIALFEETLQICEQGCYRKGQTVIPLKLSRSEREAVHPLSPDTVAQIVGRKETRSIPFVIGQTGITLRSCDSFEAARHIVPLYDKNKNQRILVLNFANPVEPGGGVTRGARAQEEDLCRKSSLFLSLNTQTAQSMYRYNRSLDDHLASDYMLLSPNVEILRDTQGELLEETKVVGVLTAAAPMVNRGGITASNVEIAEIIRRRIRGILHVAASFDYQYLVLGAWGCGAFGNDAAVVAKLFYEELRAFIREIEGEKHCRHGIKDYFRVIEFAVLDHSPAQYNYKCFEKYFADFYAEEKHAAEAKAEARRKANETSLDAIRGCLIGGAAGDALGYPVEFLKREAILKQYGPSGISAYDKDPETGLALISDDTQMTLFTATGLMLGMTRGRMRGIMGPLESYVGLSYTTWRRMQIGESNGPCYSWLIGVPEMGERRAPGNTCMSAIGGGTFGSLDTPINNSKGCGGIMRVAPVALYLNRVPNNDSRLRHADLTAAAVAALTHGHELGYMPASALNHIINRIVYGGFSLDEAVTDSICAMERLYAEKAHLREMLSRMELAVQLAKENAQDADTIKRLGEGWVAEEALAIAIYCALKYQNDFSKALSASVNHDGDSDSTGALTGNILGALWGYERIPAQWKQDLECKDVILEIADDLCHDCQMSEYSDYHDPAWTSKYTHNQRYQPHGRR